MTAHCESLLSTPGMSQDVVIGVVGLSGVGKTSLVLQWLQGHFVEETTPTVECVYRFAYALDEQVHIRLTVVDTSGQDALGLLRDRVLCGCDGFLFVYDVTDRPSFDAMASLHQRVAGLTARDGDVSDLPCLVAGNKTDITAARAVTQEEGQRLAESIGGAFVEVSAKDRVGTSAMFDRLLELTLARENTLRDSPSANASLTSSSHSSPLSRDEPVASAGRPSKRKKCVMF